MWLNVNKLSLNIEKTNYVVFRSPQNSLSKAVNINIGNIPVKKTSYIKFLGVLLDEHLSWKYHLTELSKKLARICGIFFKVRLFLPLSILICLYNSLFSSFLQYGILVWGLTHETHINPVILLQKRVIRAISFEHFTSSSTPIFFNLKILKLIRSIQCADFVLKCLNGTAPEVFYNYFMKLEHGKATRRNGTDLRMPKVRTESGKRGVYYSGTKIFNDLPLYLKTEKY